MKLIYQELSAKPLMTLNIIESEFELVCRLLVSCYFKIYEEIDGSCKYDEDYYRNILVDYANEFRIDHGLDYLLFVTESGQYNNNYKTVGRIDVAVYGVLKHYNNHVYYGFECKVVNKSTKKYIDDGMSRFIIDEKYSPNIPIGGMIGFTNARRIELIITELQNSLNNHPNKFICSSMISDPLPNFLHRYFTDHIREKTNTQIRLSHLFFDFSLPNNQSIAISGK